MDIPSEVEHLKKLFTVEEAADELRLTQSSIRRMIGEEEKLPSRLATPNELAGLLASKRIGGVPHTGVRVISQNAVDAAKTRRRRGWEKGKKRTSS